MRTIEILLERSKQIDSISELRNIVFTLLKIEVMEGKEVVPWRLVTQRLEKRGFVIDSFLINREQIFSYLLALKNNQDVAVEQFLSVWNENDYGKIAYALPRLVPLTPALYNFLEDCSAFSKETGDLLPLLK